MKSSFYKWHRILGLSALLPIIGWTLSGLSHPFMSNWFRPQIAREVFHPLSQAQMHPVLSLQQVMDQNHIAQLRNFGVVNFDQHTYYQILGRDSVYRYYSAADGRSLPDGDKRYAIYLARYFTQDTLSGIKAANIQTSFDGQYQPINHLLPVWKISLDRPDGMDIYIETGQSRMGTFNNNTRKCMLWVFDQLHTWRFLAALGGEKLRIGVMILVVGIMLLALISGLTVYGFYWEKFRTVTQKHKASGVQDGRLLHRYHRRIGLWVSLVILTFAVSGGFHLLVQWHNLGVQHKSFEQLISRHEIKLSNLQLPIPDSTITRTAIVKFKQLSYYQVLNDKKNIVYFDAENGNLLPDGDVYYAIYLSDLYYSDINQSKFGKAGLLKTAQIKQFDNEYGFINKRLPVQRVTYPNGQNWYIETTTAKLAARVADIDRAEGLSFIFLHKYFGMTWAGKNIRDIVSMLAALGVLVVSLFGFASFIKNK